LLSLETPMRNLYVCGQKVFMWSYYREEAL
jgi:hypothetical protein